MIDAREPASRGIFSYYGIIRCSPQSANRGDKSPFLDDLEKAGTILLHRRKHCDARKSVTGITQQVAEFLRRSKVGVRFSLTLFSTG